MPHDSPDLAARCSKLLRASKTKAILRVLLCLALAGCSTNAPVDPSVKTQGPKIMLQPVVVAIDFSAAITATLNANGIETQYYIEYGTSMNYGRRLPTKFLQAKLLDIVVTDTVMHLGIDTLYHCRVVATNPDGSAQSEDRTFSVSITPPTIVSEIPAAVTGPKAVVLTATVNANNRSTTCYVEYGKTTSYGMHTLGQLVRGGGNNVVVKDTIRGLTWDTTYHCRLIVENALGRTMGSDQSIVCPSASWIDLFPLEAGTTWHYAHSLSYRNYSQRFDTRGHEVWRSAGLESANSIRILVTRVDTTTTYPPYVGGDTATVIAHVDTSFSIIVTADSLNIQWYQLAYLRSGSWMAGVFTIPRMVSSGTNSLTLQTAAMKATYLSGKGLASWEDYNSSNMYFDERLTLESVSP